MVNLFNVFINYFCLECFFFNLFSGKKSYFCYCENLKPYLIKDEITDYGSDNRLYKCDE